VSLFGDVFSESYGGFAIQIRQRASDGSTLVKS